jgi:hypothetical protein
VYPEVFAKSERVCTGEFGHTAWSRPADPTLEQNTSRAPDEGCSHGVDYRFESGELLISMR